MSPAKPLRIAAAAAFVVALSGPAGAHEQAQRANPYRVLHIASYHLSMPWAAGQLKGFQEGMGNAQAEYKVLEMDILRDRSDANLRRKATEAKALIASWKPDLVYGSDDAAQEFVASQFVNTKLPFVFSGVNRDPAVYGMAGARNVAGVIEHEHFVESMKLLRTLVPGARRFAAIFDSSPHWDVLRERMRAGLARMPEVEVLAWDTVHTWTDYQAKIKGYQTRVDAIISIGFFDFGRTDGVPHLEVARWTAANSRLPDLALWENRVHSGALAAVTVSDREQGLAAGRMARAILLEGKSPASFPMKPTLKGMPAISLARARDLGLKPTTSVLLSAAVFEKYVWEAK